MNMLRSSRQKKSFFLFLILTLIIICNSILLVPSTMAQLPDLICTSLSFSPETLYPTDQINLSGYIYNQGDAATGQEFQVNFFLSTSSTQVDYNYFLHYFMMHPLGAYQGDSFNEVGIVPSDVPPGYYYVWICVNAYERVIESNIDNNEKSSDSQLHVLYKPLPNLLCNSLSFSPTEIKVGGPIMLTGSVLNNGDTSTGSGFNIKFYLSNSPNDFDQNLLLDSFDMSNLNANETRNFSRTGTIPTNTNPGYYYVWIDIDPDDRIPESNERDNHKRTDSQVHVVLTDPAQITVTVPNGGEIWNENTSYELQWTSQNTSGSVTIFYSTDGGATWKTIYNSTPDDGSASWITPTVSADITTCRIKVQDVNNSNIWDMSDNNFTIKDIPETITVIQPNGGEKWPIESTQTIQWSSSGVSSNVKIDLTRDGGASWEVLYVSTANDGSENWKVTGPPSNMCKIRITDFDGIPSDQTDGYFEITPQSPPHFTPVWTGNPFQPMTIYCTRALLYGDALVAGDEIAVFDGNKCVGTKVLTQTPTQQNLVEIICSKDDGTGNGFIEGNPILFKVWDQSGVTEYNARPQFIDLQTGAPISPIPFAGLGTAAVQLTAPGLVTQSIPLYAGWNIFSLAVTPEGDQDLLKILTPILPVLVKVIDEEGRSIVKLFGNWVNSIGNWQATEGYHINVSQNVTLQVTGMEISTPMPIPLKAGWNIMSYPCLSVSRDAKSVLQSLIDSNYLVKVINEQGQSLVKIFGNWNNSIGSMNPGEGYLINVNTNCTLTMSCSGTLFTSAATAQPIEPRHFRFDKTGNPFEPMNIFIVDARIDGQPLTMGDEIAVFDGDQLVGVSLLNSAVSITNPLEIIASKDDGSGKGFLDGHAMRYQVWRSSTGETVPINGFQVQFFDPNSGDLIAAQPFEAYGTAVAAINFTTTSVAEQQITPQSYALHQNHPNPFNPTTRISYELPEATDVDLVIFDLQGNLVKQLFNGRQNPGRYEMEWDGRNSQGVRVVSGIYFYRLNTPKFSATLKMILAK